jgi:hypothetical protein
MTVSIECPECGEENVFEVIEGEPAIPYLPDGSGYPGSGPEITEETYVCGCNAISDDTILDRAADQFAEGPDEDDYEDSRDYLDD